MILAPFQPMHEGERAEHQMERRIGLPPIINTVLRPSFDANNEICSWMTVQRTRRHVPFTKRRRESAEDILISTGILCPRSSVTAASHDQQQCVIIIIMKILIIMFNNGLLRRFSFLSVRRHQPRNAPLYMASSSPTQLLVVLASLASAPVGAAPAGEHGSRPECLPRS